jgi:hypothetical protein
MALGTSTTQVEAIQTAYNSSQQELEALWDAALETCQSVEEGDGPAGSSMASRLCALSNHVARRMRGALRLVVQKTLSVVQSHYRVNLRALDMCYIVPHGLDDDGAEAKVKPWTRLRPLPPTFSLMTSWRFFFQTLLPSGPSSLESSWALRPLDFG